ncbi:aminoacyl-tRNA hydrolase [candidate division WOR-3 bacterium]|uniref:Peptidyl-tRNA hydrolase n=1 Tax=candidate division WOR-3 bacterium TaxID=2052148 RepID=A0A937XBU5_UNCW3|nr:aminoacyl-tRNA hydrolase [candidate division WOR-3 bacterium]
MTIFGLGNPGPRYALTRHNIGFMVVDSLAARLGFRFRTFADRAVARRQFSGDELVLVKPLLFMNESGTVARKQLERRPDALLVVCDDMALPFGRLRLRPAGSDGGHNGLGSMIARLGRSDFSRLRIGIDAPARSSDGVDYVLERFPAEQEELLPEVLERAADACLAVVTQGLERAMNRFNPMPAPGAEEKSDR